LSVVIAMPNKLLLCLCLHFATCLPAASAADLYKYVDKNGTVTYSTTPPPADDKKASDPTIIKATPQMSTSRPSSCKSKECFDHEAQRSHQQYLQEKNTAARIDARNEYEYRRRQQETQMKNSVNSARESRNERLVAECRNRRMADCSEDSLRQMEDQNIPRTKNYR
jgi:hypothetical protein